MHRGKITTFEYSLADLTFVDIREENLNICNMRQLVH